MPNHSEQIKTEKRSNQKDREKSGGNSGNRSSEKQLTKEENMFEKTATALEEVLKQKYPETSSYDENLPLVTATRHHSGPIDNNANSPKKSGAELPSMSPCPDAGRKAYVEIPQARFIAAGARS